MGQYKTWTLGSELDHGLDSGLAFRPEFRSLEVKGHVHINQQQSFEYSVSLTPVANHVFN